jgi:PST family polysaccharide transporter
MAPVIVHFDMIGKMSLSQPQTNGVGTRQRLFTNVVALYFLQGLNYIIPMATLPYLVRVLGIQMYGMIAFTQSFAQYFVVLTDYGFNFSATRYTAQNRSNPRRIADMFWRVLIVKGLLMLAGMVILALILLSVPRFRSQSSYFAIAYIAVVGGVLFPQWYFQGTEKMKHISVMTGSARIITSALLFVTVHSPKDTLRALALLSAGPLLAGLIGMYVSIRELRPGVIWPSWVELWETAKDGWHLFISTAAISLYTNTNVFLVGLIAGVAQAGYFSAAEKLIRAISGLIGPISQAFFPHVNSLASQGKDLALRFISQTLRLTSLITLVPSLVMLFFPGPIAHLIFGQAVSGSPPIIRWIALLPFLIAVSNALGIQTMLTFGLDRQFSRILIGAGLLNLVMAVPLIHLFAARGAAMSVLLVEIGVTMAMIWELERRDIHVFQKVDIA